MTQYKNKGNFVAFTQIGGEVWHLNLVHIESFVLFESDNIPYLTIYFVSGRPPITFTGSLAITRYYNLVNAAL